MKGILFATGSTVALMMSQGGMAQTVPTVQNTEASDLKEADEIIVTGSRLSQTGLTSPMPVVSVTAEQIEASGLENVADVLTDLPAVGVGLTDANTQRQASAVGLNLVNLRGLGAGRTLVLVNGRRQVAGEPFTAAVDLNTIPSALVDRVEVITGGASAVYGADAVSGVINIILKDDFEGLEARVRAGISARGDGESYGVSLTGGQPFADGRGNATVNFFYDKVEGVEASARPWGISGLNTISNPASGGPNDGIPNFIHSENIRFVGPNSGGMVFVGSGRYAVNDAGTGVRPYDLGEIGNRSGRSIGGDGGFFEPYDNLSLPIERYALSGLLSYDLSTNLAAFFEGRYVKTKVLSFWQPVADDFVYAAPLLTTDNPFIPQDLRALLAANNQSSFRYYRVYDNFGRRGSDVDRNLHQYTVGLDGKFLHDWNYTVFGTYGENSQSVRLLNGRDQDRFLESVDVVTLNGQPVCRSADARARGCVALNPFGLTSATDAAIGYSRVDDSYFSKTTLKNAGASANGSLFQLPAGPVAAAVGIEYRKATAQTQPSAALQRGRTYYPQEAPVSGSISVKEAFGELRIPLLADMPLVEELTLQGAARVSDYNNNGTQTSWNLGGAYSPVSDVRFRVMRSRSVRAPNIGELFSPMNETFVFAQDPCDSAVISQAANRAQNCLALGIPANFNAPTNGRTTRAMIGGNPELDVERAKTWTAGVVLTPSFLPGFSATLDYFDIDVDGAIGSIPVATVLNNCVDLPVAVTDNPLCSAITRDPTTRGVTLVQATQLNIGRLSTSGWDFGVNYRFGLDRVFPRLPGRLALSLTGTYLEKLRQITDANNPQSENQREGMLGNPKWEFLSTVGYTLDKLRVTWRAHFIDSTHILSSINLYAGLPSDQFDLSHTGTKVFHDLNVAYDVNTRLEAQFTVNNLFDSKPPARAFNIHQGIYDASIYPNLGTMFSAALKYRF